MDTVYSIGQLASKVGISVSTLRRWDREGLLKPELVTKGNHRRYTEDAVINIVNRNTRPQTTEIKKEIRNNTQDSLKLSELPLDQFKSVIVSEANRLISYIQQTEKEYDAILTATSLSSNEVLKPLLQKEVQRVEGTMFLAMNDLNKLIVYSLHTIWTKFNGSLQFEVYSSPALPWWNHLQVSGELADVFLLLTTRKTSQSMLLAANRRINKTLMLSMDLPFMEMLRRLDFYYSNSGISLKALAKKYGISN